MAVKSVYLPDVALEGDLLRIRGDEHHHLSVGRVEVNESVEIFDGKGNVWQGKVATHSRSETTVRILEKRTLHPDSIQIELGLALIRPAAIELALEKAVELGVNRILPFIAQRSNIQAGDRRGRWLRIVVEAAKQSKRYHLPQVEEPQPFARLLARPAQTKILFSERDGSALRPALSGSPVLYLIGPEGGWTDTELSDARSAGFSLVTLGAGILKAETAAIVGAALIRYELQSV